MSLALARKYRPATFDDLIGQEAVSQTLSLALDSNRLSHAYLFSGLRGSGKTSTARIFAKALLCEKGATSHPCEICPHCIMAGQNNHMDIIEMDAASNRGIDDIKDLIEHTKYKPSSARYKIFIIDEVHMLTNQAFNALLKTLEEPPAFVKFILATTDPLKLPATILSRTQHFRFKKIPQNLVLKHLEHILDLENVGYEIEALEILARSGAGSIRDSLTLTDQAIVYSKNFVDLNTVTKMLGIIEASLLEQLLADIYKKDYSAILAFIKMASDYEAEMILDEFTLYLKDLLLSDDKTFTPMVIERFFIIIAEFKTLLAIGSDGEFILALSLFKMMETIKEHKEIEIPKKIKISPAPQIKKALNKERVFQDSKPLLKTTKSLKTTSISTKKASTPKNYHLQTFEKIKEKIYDRNYNLGTCFEKNITFISFQNNELIWESIAKDADKKQLITYWSIINKFVKDIFGSKTKIINISKKETTTTHTIKKRSVKQNLKSTSVKNNMEMKSSCIAPEAGKTEAAKEKDPSSLLNEPMVKKAIALFDPKKVKIKRNS